MMRTPLRPLARILKARATGQNPNDIEQENRGIRREEEHIKARHRAEGRLVVMGLFFILAFLVVGLRMGTVSMSEPREPKTAASSGNVVVPRADIVDRKGRILATNMITHALYAHPHVMVDKMHAVDELVKIFPDLKRDRLIKDFTGKRKFLWLKRRISPEQMQKVHDIGDPGLLFGKRDMRLYPNGKLAAHILGGVKFGDQAVHSAELVGVAGVERKLDKMLGDPARNGAPVTLSIDIGAQAAMRDVLASSVSLFNARGASAVLMDAHTGEIRAMTSLPDFDPNDRPVPLTKGIASDSPLFNRAVQGLYELGSTFKIFTIAQAVDEGMISPTTMINTKGPMKWGKFKIKDYRNYGPKLSATDVIAKSSNLGTARVAMDLGATRQKRFLKSLGFFEPTPVELAEAPNAKPLLPKNWSEISTITISYGHGLSASPLHLATAYASLLNGGEIVKPTLIEGQNGKTGGRIVSQATSKSAREMLRKVVTKGTASYANVPGYEIGGKTGSAEKAKRGGYADKRNIATFASVFPASDPKYILVVSLDEAKDTSGKEERRTAGWTAVPVASEMVQRIAPILGLRPVIAGQEVTGVTLTSN
ncbi:MAG: peptidoglycan D,D-transpeptidase FtsI family protein [Halocynthiibacter sp.]